MDSPGISRRPRQAGPQPATRHNVIRLTKAPRPPPTQPAGQTAVPSEVDACVGGCVSGDSSLGDLLVQLNHCSGSVTSWLVMRLGCIREEGEEETESCCQAR
ncbi:hypothetical protein DPEC_G00137560 [Dallia pectoralis]|uniref:Uncharacterized protein n=1 Tax=Dallia pectoralis TaxID=75939 RepID=A0ACC2GLM0_DALPE|nr:hypothetical protein DPEC_G00137560 [Dallia pectoralis]